MAASMAVPKVYLRAVLMALQKVEPKAVMKAAPTVC